MKARIVSIRADASELLEAESALVQKFDDEAFQFALMRVNPSRKQEWEILCDADAFQFALMRVNPSG